MLQFVEETLDAIQRPVFVPQIVDDLGVVLPQLCDVVERLLPVALLQPFEDLLQGIGRLSHRRDDDEEMLFVVDDPAQVSHPVGIPHRRASEFVDLHILTFLT